MILLPSVLRPLRLSGPTSSLHCEFYKGSICYGILFCFCKCMRSFSCASCWRYLCWANKENGVAVMKHVFSCLILFNLIIYQFSRSSKDFHPSIHQAIDHLANFEMQLVLQIFLFHLLLLK